MLVLAVVAYLAVNAFRPIPPAPFHPEPTRWSAGNLTIAYLGHASVLIDVAGTRILTDPTFFSRIGVAVGPLTIGPKRVVQAALRPEELPPLDAVLISHAHMDSLDMRSLERVASAPVLVVPVRTRDLVEALGFARVVELPWGATVMAGTATIEAVEVSHWGKRWPWDGRRGYNGYLVSKDDTTVLFASDTAYTEKIAALGRVRPLTAAILGCGAYDPWIANHADPEQVWRMFEQSRACYLVPVHWDTFRLGVEPLGDAMARLLAVAGPEADRVVVRAIGETWTTAAGGGCAPPASSAAPRP